MTDPVRAQFRRQGYADHVVAGGLPYLVETWERVAASVAAGEEQYQDDYLNDMDGRRILDEALAVAPSAERTRWAVRVQRADSLIRPHLVVTRECLWGEANAVAHGYTRERDWWYFHRPPVVGPDWRVF